MDPKEIFQTLQPILMMGLMSKVDHSTYIVFIAIAPILWSLLKHFYYKYYTVIIREEKLAKVIVKTVSHGKKNDDKLEGEDTVEAVAEKLIKIQNEAINELLIPKAHLVYIQDENERSKYDRNYRPMITAIPQGDIKFIWKGIECLASIQISKEEKAETTSITLSSMNCSVSVLHDFVQKALDEKWEGEHLQREKGFIHGIHNYSRQNGWTFRELTIRKTFSNVYLPLALQADIENDISTFIEKEQFYISQGIPHKRGYLFYGPPGTGKSSCVYALAHKLQYHVRVINIKKIDNLTQTISFIKDPCIILLEEIDFQISYNFTGINIGKSEEKCKGGNDMISELMHILDGYDCDLNDKIIIMTTNNKENIPSALIRPGRIDRHFHFDLCDSGEATRVAQKITGFELPSPNNTEIRISTAELINRVILPNINDPEILREEMRNLSVEGKGN